MFTTIQKAEFFSKFGEFLKLYRQVDRNASEVCNYVNGGKAACCFQFKKEKLSLFASSLKLKNIPIILIEDKETSNVLCIIRDADSNDVQRICYNVLNTIISPTAKEKNNITSEGGGANERKINATD